MAIVKDIRSNRIEWRQDLKISAFKPAGLKKILEKKEKTIYIVGVGYEEGDFQICISGRFKNKENIYDTIRREMGEELGLKPLLSPTIISRNGSNWFSEINIKDTDMSNACIDTVNTEIDIQERAIICVYGTKDDVTSYISKVILPVLNDDHITHIWADTVENILKLL